MSVINEFKGDYFWLSNFYAFSIYYEGISYPTNEHAFQAAKTISPEDRLMIARLSTPAQAKRAGQRVLLRPYWEVKTRYSVMRELISIKFSDRHLRDRLVATYPNVLVEGNTWGDRTWGVDLVTGWGNNLLGWMLMEERQKWRVFS